jgi:hypothetical protein
MAVGAEQRPETASGLAYIYAGLRISFGVIGLLFVLGMADMATLWEPTGLMLLPGPGSLRGRLIESGLARTMGLGVFLLNAAASLLMTVGFRSRFSVPLMFIASAAQAWWNPLPLSGAFEVRSAVLFGLMWADCGEKWSIDSWLASRRGAVGRSSRDDRLLPWPLYVIRFQVAVIYLSTGLYKLGGVQWRHGTALHYVLNNNAFARFPTPPPPEWTTLLVLGTYLTLLWELAFPLLVAFRRTRLLAIGVGIALHLGMWVTMELGPFPWVMMASYLAFLSPNWVAKKLQTSPR